MKHLLALLVLSSTAFAAGNNNRYFDCYLNTYLGHGINNRFYQTRGFINHEGRRFEYAIHETDFYCFDYKSITCHERAQKYLKIMRTVCPDGIENMSDFVFPLEY